MIQYYRAYLSGSGFTFCCRLSCLVPSFINIRPGFNRLSRPAPPLSFFHFQCSSFDQSICGSVTSEPAAIVLHRKNSSFFIPEPIHAQIRSKFLTSASTHQRKKRVKVISERKLSKTAMVTLLVATTSDPASINPANALLGMPGWQPGPHFQEDMKSFVNEGVRVLVHGKSIVAEDDLDKRWEEITGEVIDEIIFFSKHVAASNKPALTVHPIGVPHLREGDVPPQGGKPGWAALPSPRIGPWLRLLKRISQAHDLVPEFEITLEATHHGPLTNKPTMFLEIGSTEDYWKRQDAAFVMAQLVWEGLGLGGGTAVGNWSGDNVKKKVLLGIGGGHYVPRHMDVVLKDDVWVGHLLSGYSLPMEDPNQSKVETNTKEIGGTWRESIKVSYEATTSAFPGGEILAHLDHKSFKSWQKNAITGFLTEQNIKIGKPNDFY